MKSLVPVTGHPNFEQLYGKVRQREQRLYPDEVVVQLPDIPPDHPHVPEWRMRKRTYRRLSRYLRRLGGASDILEVGCGNGWLAARLAENTPSLVTGIDIHISELEQARRIFKRDNLQFKEGSLEVLDPGTQRFDKIIFSASIQYFPSATMVLQEASRHLYPGGEIHIIDTHFYDPAAVKAARQRSRDYYAALGFPEMADRYFHHTLHDLKGWNYHLLADPASWWNRWFKKDVFHWIVIRPDR